MTLLMRYCLFAVSILLISAIAECASDDGDGNTTDYRPYAIEEDELPDFDLSFPNCGFSPAKSKERKRRNAAGVEQPSSRSGELQRRDVTKHNNILGIVGGHDAEPNSWPWMVSVQINEKHVCGGSLISLQYVLTAAHCCDNNPKKFRLVLGSLDKDDGTKYSVKNLLVHPDYDSEYPYENDLCLLKVKEKVVLTEKVYPVCLPSDGIRDKIKPKQNMVTVTGWGLTTKNGKASEKLKEVEIPIVSLSKCKEKIKEITKLSICAGEEKDKDSCQGDSGGPMVAQLNDSSWAQVGVSSFGIGCGDPEYPGVYVRLSQYIKWLQKETDLGRS